MYPGRECLLADDVLQRCDETRDPVRSRRPLPGSSDRRARERLSAAFPAARSTARSTWGHFSSFLPIVGTKVIT